MIRALELGDPAGAFVAWLGAVFPGLPVVNEMGDQPLPPAPPLPYASVTQTSVEMTSHQAVRQTDEDAANGLKARIKRQQYRGSVAVTFRGPGSRLRAHTFHLTADEDEVNAVTDPFGTAIVSSPTAIEDATASEDGVTFLEAWILHFNVAYEGRCTSPGLTIETLVPTVTEEA